MHQAQSLDFTLSMNLTLSIETSNPEGGVALLREGRPVGELFLRSSQTHSRRLLASCRFLLEHCESGFRDLDLLAVSLGPGSFTGLRIGLATAKGLAYALGVPIVGVATLDAMASQVLAGEGELVCPVQHARLNEVYAALYRSEGNGSLQRISSYQSVIPEELASMIPAGRVWMLGDALNRHWTVLSEILGERARRVPAYLDGSRALTVGCLGYREFVRLGRGHDLRTLVPLYVRPSEAQVRRMEARGKASGYSV